MKMLMVCLNSSLSELFQIMLEETAVDGFTKMEEVKGNGKEGKHYGRRPFYETNDIFYVALEDDRKVEAILGYLQELRSKYPKEGIKVFAQPVEELI